MKKLSFLLLFACCFFMHSFAQKDTLYKLYKAKQFLQLEETNTDSQHPLYTFYKAVFANVCNQPAQSNEYLDSFVEDKRNPPMFIGHEYWLLRNDNDVKLFEYKEAATTLALILKKYKSKYSAREYQSEKYTVEIWRALSNEPRQAIVRTGASAIPLTHDLAGLINISVNGGSVDTNFVFDTGAGMSSITESLAKKMNFRMLPGNQIKVSGFSGIFNEVQIAVADELKIGDIVIHNEPFLVFKDEALSFANGAYKINGIIGFPVAKELGSITITPATLLVNDITLKDTTSEKDLFVELLHPIVLLRYKGKLLPFNFDTGANTSEFSKPFYDMYGAELSKTGKYEGKESASAGGTRKYKALMADNVKFMLGNEEISFPTIEIDTENYHISGKELYGNIGQDLLKQYKRVTINFKMSYLRLEN